MKKLFILVVILLMCGQVLANPSFGLRLGLNSANATHGPGDNYTSDSKAGLILGGALEIAINKKATRTIRLEAAYVQKGWADNGSIFLTDVSGKVDIDEFVITPAVIFRLSDTKTVPYILVGADVGFTLKSKATINVGGVSATGDIPEWEGTNVGLDLGAGLLFPSGEGEFLTELRFNIGMTDMYPGDDWDVTTNGVQFIFGYNFTVPK